MNGQSLFDKVVELCGVSSVLAPGMVRRALLDGKVKVEEATPADYRAALPRLLARLRAYVSEDEAQRRARKIAGLLSAVESGRSNDGDPDEDTLIGRVSAELRAGTPAAGAARSPGSGELTLRSAGSGEIAIPEYDADDVTLMGRRYTADELRQTGALLREETAKGAPASSDDLRKTRR